MLAQSMSNYNTLPVKPLMDGFLKLQDHYKIVFKPKNDLVISQAYPPIKDTLIRINNTHQTQYQRHM